MLRFLKTGSPHISTAAVVVETARSKKLVSAESRLIFFQRVEAWIS